MKLRLTLTGTTPLLMHNVQLASPLNPYSKRLKALNSKRNKTDEDRLEVARVEFEGSLYFDQELGPYLPGQNVFKSLIEGARLTKSGKKIERGLVLLDVMSPLAYKGPRDVNSLWSDGESEFVDIRPVTVQRQKVDRCRPIFRHWSTEAEVMIDPKILEFDELVEVSSSAGRMIGVGDYRLVYGRYSAQVERI